MSKVQGHEDPGMRSSSRIGKEVTTREAEGGFGANGCGKRTAKNAARASTEKGKSEISEINFHARKRGEVLFTARRNGSWVKGSDEGLKLLSITRTIQRKGRL